MEIDNPYYLTLIIQNMNFYRYSFMSLLLGVMVFFAAGCGSESVSSDADAATDGRYYVVCTVGMITDIVRNVAGDYAKVEGIIGDGVDPHLYKPTRGDVVKLSQADVVFYNGLLLEGKMSDVLDHIAGSGKLVRAVTEAILDETDYLLDKEDDSDHTDPHVWMDISGWMRAIPVVADALADYDSVNAQRYQANAAAYIEKLKGLNVYAVEAMATIPESQRVLVTAHDAFQYLGRAYGIEVRGVQGISTESEAGLRDLEQLIDFIVEKKIPSVFIESSVSDKNVKALVEGADARGHELVIGGELFSDAMGEAGTYKGTYIGMLDHNVTTIVNALGGSAKGFRAVGNVE